MKITVEFNSLAEIDEFCTRVLIGGAPAEAVGDPQGNRGGTPGEAQEEPKKEKTKKSTPKSEKPKDEPVTAPDEPKKEEPKAVDVGELKVEVRRLLAQVNKKTGANTAAQWIEELTSAKKLTEVEKPEELEALKAKALEALNG